MLQHSFRAFTAVFLASFLFLNIGCGNTISLFDEHAYTQATSTKVDAMNVMDLANESYKLHKKDISDLTTEIDKIYEYERNRNNNAKTIALWNDIRDTTKESLYGFLRRWENKDVLGKVFIV